MISNELKIVLGPAAILGGTIIIAASIGAYSFYGVHTLDNTLSVTGSAVQDAKADSAKLTVSVSRQAYEEGLAGMQTRIGADAQQVTNYFTKNGILAEKITSSPVFVDQEYSNDNNAPRRYNVHEDVTVSSDDPLLIQKLSKNVNTLSSQGILISTRAPEYFISTLPDIRISLIGKAVTDAKKRADEIAKSTGRSVGRLQSAASGVVQVLAPDSVEVADYGSYDTSTIDKRVMVTARATFYLR